jgi:hypothetical protein
VARAKGKPKLIANKECKSQVLMAYMSGFHSIQTIAERTGYSVEMVTAAIEQWNEYSIANHGKPLFTFSEQAVSLPARRYQISREISQE